MVLLTGAVTPEATAIRSPKMTIYSSSPQRWLDYKRDELGDHILGGRSKYHRNLMHNTVVRFEEEDDTYIIRYHNTDIITYYEDHILIDVDGWETVTTKVRLNAHTPFSFWQEKGIWYFSVPETAGEYRYLDGLKFVAEEDKWYVRLPSNLEVNV